MVQSHSCCLYTIPQTTQTILKAKAPSVKSNPPIRLANVYTLSRRNCYEKPHISVPLRFRLHTVAHRSGAVRFLSKYNTDNETFPACWDAKGNGHTRAIFHSIGRIVVLNKSLSSAIFASLPKTHILFCFIPSRNIEANLRRSSTVVDKTSSRSR